MLMQLDLYQHLIEEKVLLKSLLHKIKRFLQFTSLMALSAIALFQKAWA
jgi:hypothetical protein